MEGELREFELVDPDTDAYADYSARFNQYNEDESGSSVQTYSLVLQEGGHIIAGGRGHVFLGAVEVRGLWVDEVLRGEGIGSELLKAIEHEARKRGASKAMLYTYSWKADHLWAIIRRADLWASEIGWTPSLSDV